jgi:hypothetical protein
MPVTPFHLGPGIALKSVAGESFSFLAFGVAQVAMDIEPGIGMLRGAPTLHGWTHTYAGATAIGAIVFALARPACAPILRWWNAELTRNRLDWLAGTDTISRTAAATGAFIGTYSHVLLDSFMHADMRPFAPFSDANGLLALVSVPALHIGCAIAGAIGVAAWIAIGLRRRRVGRNSD